MDWIHYFETHDYFIKDCGAALTVCEPGHAEMELKLENRHMSNVGRLHVHAGVLYSLAETVSAAAVLPFGYNSMAVEGKITYVDAAAGGTVVAVAKAKDQHEEGSGTCRVRIQTKEGKLIANARFSIFYTGEPFADDTPGA